MSRCFDAERAQRIEHRVDERRQRSGATRFAHALDAQRIHFRRGHVLLHRDVRQQSGARHVVIAERRREELPRLAVVDRVLAEHLARALRHRAVHLAFDDRVIDDDTAIVDRHIGNDVGDAGVGIDFDFGDVAAVGEGRGKRAFAFDRESACGASSPSVIFIAASGPRNSPRL